MPTRAVLLKSVSRRLAKALACSTVVLAVAPLAWCMDPPLAPPVPAPPPTTAMTSGPPPRPSWVDELKVNLARRHEIREVHVRPIGGRAYVLEIEGRITYPAMTGGAVGTPEERAQSSVSAFLEENRGFLLGGREEAIVLRKRVPDNLIFNPMGTAVAVYRMSIDDVEIYGKDVKIVVSQDGTITSITASVPRVSHDVLEEIRASISESNAVHADHILDSIQKYRDSIDLPGTLTPPGQEDALWLRYKPFMFKGVFLEPPYVRWDVQAYWYGSGRWQYYVDGVTGEVLEEYGPDRGY